MARVIEEKEDEIRLMKLQMAKQKTTENDEELKKQMAIKNEEEFQNQIYKQTQEQAADAERKTRAACSAIGNTMQCYIGSIDNIQQVDKYTDEQAELIIMHDIDDKAFVLVKECRRCTKDALLDVGSEQRRRVLDKINKRRAQQHDSTSMKKFDDVDEDLEKFFTQAAAQGTPQRQGRADSNQSTPVKVSADDGGDGSEDGDFGLSAYSIIPMNEKKPNRGDDDEPGDNGTGGNGESRNSNEGSDENKEKGHEFQLVNSRNIAISKCSGSHGCKITYIDFNENIRNYISSKGRDGEILNTLLTGAEKQGDEPISNETLKNLEKKIPKIWEFNRAVLGALKNWTVGEAKKLVTYGIKGGFDAWRRLYNEYLPMDQTKQDIILTEIISLEPVKEKDVRLLLNRIEELRDKHDRCGYKPLAENILKRITMTCLPSTVIKPIAIALDDATTFREVRRLIIRQTHNVVTGMMDGDMQQPIYSVQTEQVANEDDN